MGSMSFNDNSTKARSSITIAENDISTVVCRQRLQSVETELKLAYPSLAILKNSPPEPDRSTAKWLLSPSSNDSDTTFQFALNNLPTSRNNPNGSMSGNWTLGDIIDRFNQALVHIAQREDNLSLNDLIGSKNVDAYMKVVRRLYGRYMAQVISNNMRVKTQHLDWTTSVTNMPWTPTASPTIISTSSQARTSSTRSTRTSSTSTRSSRMPESTATSVNARRKRQIGPATTLSATLTQTGPHTKIRLKQSKAPKIALQIMLGCMAIGAVVARLLLSTKETLQREPYWRAALLCNADMLRTLDGGDVGKGVVRDGKEYRLDWWWNDSGWRRYGVCAEK